MKTLDEILQEMGTPIGSYDDNTRLEDLGYDSLDCYNIQGEIELSYGIIINECDRIHPRRRIQEVRKLVGVYL